MEVKMVPCPKCGNYYDSAKHASCPYCNANGCSSGGFRTESANGGMVGTEYAESIGKTEPAYGGTFNPNGGGSTVPIYGPDRVFPPTIIGGDVIPGAVTAEPVVGWLVCIDGAVKGMDFRIHAGYNYIGRESGDIQIGGDTQISRQNHAMIAYDPENNSYYFGPSNGRNIVHVNGKAVFSAIEVHSYDVISIGKCKLMFVAMCGEEFSWERGLTGKNG